MTRYEIRIEELVLRGVPRAQAPAVVAAMEARLQALADGSAAQPGREGAGQLTSHAENARLTALGSTVADRVWAAIDDARGGRPR